MNRRRLYINGKFTAQSVTGVQRAAIELVRAIDAGRARRLSAFDDVVLLCPPQGVPPELQSIEVRRCGSERLGLQAWEQLELPWAARDGLLLNLSGSAPWLAARRSVCMLHDAAVFDHGESYRPAFRHWYRRLFRHLGAHAAALLTVSQFSRDRLCSALALPPGRLAVVHHGADHFERVATEPGTLEAYGLQGKRYLLIVGTQKRTKNFEAVLQAWRDMAHEPDEFLVWVGGANARVFQGQGSFPAAGEIHSYHSIVYVGVVSDPRLKALYEGAAGLVMPSQYEGFGLPAVEAMSCGCPVAAASAASLPEVCGDAAVYFRPDDSRGLREVMQAVLSDAALRAHLRERAVARAAALRWEDAAARLMSLLDGLARPAAPGS